MTMTETVSRPEVTETVMRIHKLHCCGGEVSLSAPMRRMDQQRQMTGYVVGVRAKMRGGLFRVGETGCV
jgi:hypothetical protein